MANSPVKLCTCPVDPIVPSIPSTVCTESFGQVLKFGLANKTTQNFEDTVNGITDQASWTAALAAVDTTKVQLTPILSDVLLAANSPINVGGDDNTTPDGVPVLRARTSAQGTAILRDITAAVKVALQEYECLAGSDNIGGIYPMGRDFILAVVDTTGSTPRKAGAQMIIREDGSTLGTISGGLVEKKTCDKALEILKSGQPEILEMKLTNEDAGDMGLLCGGWMKVLIERV